MKSSFARALAFETLGMRAVANMRMSAMLASGALPVLCFHKIGTELPSAYPGMPAKIFSELIGWLAVNFEIVSFDGLASRKHPAKPPIVLSFDDGYKDFINIAMPVLRAHRLRVNVNLVPHCIESGLPPVTVMLADFLGSAPSALLRELRLPLPGVRIDTDDRIGTATRLSAAMKQLPLAEQMQLYASLTPQIERFDGFRASAMLTRDDIRQVAAEHEIGAHSYEHASMAVETDAYLAGDLQRCRSYFKEAFGIEPRIYAFPNGSIRKGQPAQAQQAGFDQVLLVGDQFSRVNTAVHYRFNMTGDSSAEARFRALGGLTAPRPGPVMADTPRRRVLCVIETVGVGGGAEQLLVSLVPAIRALGVDVEIAALFPHEPSLDQVLRARGVPVHQLNLTGETKALRAILPLRSLIRSGKFDVVWGNLRLANIIAKWAAKFTGVPTLATLHSEGYAKQLDMPWKARLTTAFEGALLRSVTKVAVSQAVAEDFRAYFGWQDFQIIHNGIDQSLIPSLPEAAQRAQIRARHGVAADQALFVVPARLIPKKGHIHLLEALARLAGEHELRPTVLCFGNGPLRNELARKIEELGLTSSVRLCPAVEHGELMAIESCADAVVLPSLREPFGIAAAEAMLLGVPIVVSGVDGLLEVVGDENCALTVPPGDAPALSAAMLYTLRAPAAAHDRARLAQARARANFDVAVLAQGWVDVFRAMNSPRRDYRTDDSRSPRPAGTSMEQA